MTPPFHPHLRHPESTFGETSDEPNAAYELVRNCFILAGLDASRIGTSAWNPLGEFVRPGQTVVLKPNLVKECHPGDPEGWRYVLTHGSVVRAVADYLWTALDGVGTVVVADAPQTDSSFSRIVATLGLDSIEALYRERGLDFRLIDLRREEWVNRDGVIVARHALPGDPAGSVSYDLADGSELCDHGGGGRYYGADYDIRAMNSHHTGGRHEYLLSRSVIDADVLVSLPKLKTHKKAGITVSLKNLVGVNADKNWLPHHTAGSPDDGGDEHPQPSFPHRVERATAAAFHRLATRYPSASAGVHRRARTAGLRVFGDSGQVIRSGNWWGNDTLWRMCLDLNKIVAYGRGDGRILSPGPTTRRRHLVIVDGIMAGEGSGPIEPKPVEAGLIAFGSHPASVDAACAVLMGFDPDRIPIVRQAFRCRRWPLGEWGWDAVSLVSEHPLWAGALPDISPDTTLHLTPHFAWTGQIERASAGARA